MQFEENNLFSENPNPHRFKILGVNMKEDEHTNEQTKQIVDSEFLKARRQHFP